MNKNLKQGIQLGLCTLVLTCTACSERNAEPSAGETAGSGEPSQPVQESDMNATTIGENLTRQVSGAVADLAKRAGIAADTIIVVQARSVQWGSGALGCPKKGMNYTQAIVPGVLLLLEADGTIYRYHGSTESELAYCPDERAEAPAYGPGEEFM